MKKLKYLGVLLVAIILMTGCGKTNPKKDLENALSKFKDVDAISMNLEIKMGTAEMKIPMKMELTAAKDFVHMNYSVSMLGQTESQEVYMRKKDDQVLQYQFDDQNNRWVYTTVESDTMDTVDKVTGEEFEKNIDEFMKLLKSVKKVKTDKEGYDKLEITVATKDIMEKVKESAETDEEKKEIEESYKDAPEEIKFYAYLKDGELSSITVDASTMMEEGALLGMTIYDITIEVVAINDKVDKAYPKTLDEATYLTEEEFAAIGQDTSDDEDEM